MDIGKASSIREASPVESALNRVRNGRCELSNALDLLQERIGSVLQPEYKESAGTSREVPLPPKDPCSQLEDELNANAGQIEALTTKVHQIISRIRL